MNKTDYTYKGVRYTAMYARHNNPKAWLWVSLRTRCQSKGIPFSITFDYMMSLWPEDGLCPILGIPMVHNKGRGGKPDSASIDKIIPHLGYVEHNVMWLSLKANKMKGENTLDTLTKFIAIIHQAEQYLT